MRALMFLLIHRYANSIRRIFSRPLTAIITGLAVVGMLGSLVASFFMKHEGIGGNIEVIVACLTLSMGLLILNAVLNSAQSAMYTLQDANLLFKAPLKRGQVLLYAIVDVAPASLMTALFFTFYFPYLVGDRIGVASYLVTLLFSVLMVASVYLMFYWIYLWDVKRPGIRRGAKRALWALMLAAAAAFFCVLAAKGFDLSRAAAAFFSGVPYKAFPVFGWAHWGVSSAFEGNYLSGSLPALLLMLGFNALLTFFMLRMDVDFYEKALNDSYKIKEILDEVKSNRFDTRSTAKVRKRSASATFRPGAASLLSRQMLEMKKTSTMFALRDFITGAVYIVMAKLMDLDFFFTFAMFLFLSVTMAGNESWNKDFKKPYVYLIPESSLRKAVYSVFPGLVRAVVIGTAMVTASGIAFAVPAVELIGYIVMNISFSLVFVMSEVLSYKVMRGLTNPVALSFLRLFFVIAAAIPAGAVFALLQLILPGATTILGLALILLGVNLLVFLAMAMMSRDLFERSDLI